MNTYFYYNKIRYTYENNKRMYYVNDLLNFFGVPPFEEFLRTREAESLLYILSGKHIKTHNIDYIYDINIKRVVKCIQVQIRKDEWTAYWLVSGELLNAYYQWFWHAFENDFEYIDDDCYY